MNASRENDQSSRAVNTALSSAALERILASAVFAQARRQSRLLTYLVEESIADRASRLSQYAIGLEVFDRPEDFDPTVDSIVRVEVARLRSKLREYYDLHPTEKVVFRLPKGKYAIDMFVPDEMQPVANAQSGSSNAVQHSLAVLPFVNFGEDRAQDYFADGITDDLITDLSKIAGLKVIARNSAFSYKGRNISVDVIGRELGITHVLEGSVRKVDKRLRINAQLVSCADGSHLWAERFDRELTDIFAVQDEVIARIVSALSIALQAPDRLRLSSRATQELLAYDNVLRGSAMSWSRAEIDKAYALYQKATEFDAAYGLAYAKMASNRWYAWLCGWSDENTLERAQGEAARAMELDPELSEAHSAHGFIRFWRGDHEAGITDGQRAVSLDPAGVRALERLSLCLTLFGRCDFAQDYLDRAKAVNPHEPYYYPRALIAYFRDDTDTATQELLSGLERFPVVHPDENAARRGKLYAW